MVRSKKMIFKFVLLGWLVGLVGSHQICPEKCDCQKETLNCTLKELVELPSESPVAVRYA